MNKKHLIQIKPKHNISNPINNVYNINFLFRSYGPVKLPPLKNLGHTTTHYYRSKSIHCIALSTWTHTLNSSNNIHTILTIAETFPTNNRKQDREDNCSQLHGCLVLLCNNALFSYREFIITTIRDPHLNEIDFNTSVFLKKVKLWIYQAWRHR